MKKILYVTTVSRTINAFLIPHIERLMDEGYEVDCACSIDKEVDKRIVAKGCNIFDTPFSRNPLDVKNIKAFKKLIKLQIENQYDIVHVHTPVASVFGRLLKRKFPSLKTIYTVHGFHFFKGGPKLNWLIYYPIEKLMAKYTDLAITINSEDFERAKQIGIKEVYMTNGVGLDLDFYNKKLYDKKQCRKKFNINHNDFVIVMIAEVNKNKNHEQMITVVEKLVKHNYKIKVLCVGEGVLFNKIKEKIKNRNLNEVIKMLGYRKNINEIITCADIGLLVSYREGLPRNIMELMAFGKPVVGTNIRGIRDIIKDGYNGYIADIGDIDNMVKVIELLIDNKELLASLGENAYNSVDIYSIDEVVNDIATFYI